MEAAKSFSLIVVEQLSRTLKVGVEEAVVCTVVLFPLGDRERRHLNDE